MKQLLLFIFSIYVFNCMANDSLKVEQKMPSSFTVSLARDNIYDFYTYAVASYGISKNKSLSFFTLLRAIQFGGGVSFLTMKSRLIVTPLISLSSGKTQSGSSRGLLGESVCPTIVKRFFMIRVRFITKL